MHYSNPYTQLFNWLLIRNEACAIADQWTSSWKAWQCCFQNLSWQIYETGSGNGFCHHVQSRNPNLHKIDKLRGNLLVKYLIVFFLCRPILCSRLFIVICSVMLSFCLLATAVFLSEIPSTGNIWAGTCAHRELSCSKIQFKKKIIIFTRPAYNWKTLLNIVHFMTKL